MGGRRKCRGSDTALESVRHDGDIGVIGLNHPKRLKKQGGGLVGTRTVKVRGEVISKKTEM